MAKASVGRKVIGSYAFKPRGTTALSLRPGSQTVAWEKVRPRPDLDTRSLDPRHILSLARSIAAVGLIQPLAIDTSGKLIAGCHRLAVWALLSIDDPETRRATFLKSLPGYTAAKPGGDALSEPEAMAKEIGDLDVSGWQEAHPKGLVPVLVFDEDAARTKNKALLREVAENEKRRSYTTREVQDLAKRLEAAGFEDIKGRPTEDQQSVRQELARILGKSSRQIRRYLNDPEVPAKPKGGQGVRLSRLLIYKASKLLPRLQKNLAKDAEARRVVHAAAELREAIDAYLAKDR